MINKFELYFEKSLWSINDKNVLLLFQKGFESEGINTISFFFKLFLLSWYFYKGILCEILL